MSHSLTVSPSTLLPDPLGHLSFFSVTLLHRSPSSLSLLYPLLDPSALMSSFSLFLASSPAFVLFFLSLSLLPFSSSPSCCSLRRTSFCLRAKEAFYCQAGINQRLIVFSSRQMNHQVLRTFGFIQPFLSRVTFELLLLIRRNEFPHWWWTIHFELYFTIPKPIIFLFVEAIFVGKYPASLSRKVNGYVRFLFYLFFFLLPLSDILIRDWRLKISFKDY